MTGFDVACVLLGTAAHLTDTDDAIGCLRGINHALAPGGIALLELEHPYDLFEGQLMDAQGVTLFLFFLFPYYFNSRMGNVWAIVLTRIISIHRRRVGSGSGRSEGAGGVGARG